ncbi:hypothetical protein BTJ08_09270 [Lactobacillus delbrueckii subsp. bulgaricus]|nr:hypothetical protein [Lactobacillus delbrueckii subsp. bulgaricus]MBT9071948.1 hypothetical protein [Lactobacillus delbrueckii subsp. bulgaricus]
MAESKRARAWAAIVYPESAPEDWKDRLDALHLVWACILHDKDVNPTGEVKKAHYHVLMLFDGLKSYDQIKAITDQLSAPIPQRVASVRGMVRYFIHLDNPEKHQYDRSEIEQHGGIDIEPYFELSISQRNVLLKEMASFIIDNQVDSFADFVQYCITEAPSEDWFDVAANKSTLFLNKLIDSVYHKVSRRQSDFGNQLDTAKSIREMQKKGVTQQEMADTLGVSVSTIKRYLKSS